MALSKAAKKARSSRPESAPSIKLPLIILLLLAVLGVGGYFAYEWHLKQSQEEYRQQQEGFAQAFTQRYAKSVRSISARLDAAIDLITFGSLINIGDEEALAAKTAELASVDKNIIRVRVIKPGHAQIDYDVSPPLGYGALDLLRRSEKEGKAPPIEVFLKGKDDEHIAVVRRIEGAEGVLLGHLFIYFKLDALKQATAKIKPTSGYAELQQMVPQGRPLILSKMGNSAWRGPSPTMTIPISGTAWRLVYWVKPAPKATVPLDGLPLVPIGGALVALLLGVSAMVVMRRRRAAVVEASEESSTATSRKVVVNPEAVASGGAPTSEGIEVEEAPPEAVASVGAPTSEGIEVEEAPAKEPAAEDKTEEIPASIFRAYDIRGVVGESLTPGVVKAIGRAIGTEAARLNQRTVAVGRDGRTSGPILADALIEGLRSAGRDVVDVGEVPTPVLYYATHYLETGSGVMVTGSHNPPDYNGLKIMIDGETLFGDRISALRTTALSGEFTQGSGKLESTDITSEYIRRITEDIPVAIGDAFKVVIDCGNGVAGAVAPDLIRALGHDVVELYCDVDGSFPNHHPDPSVPANLKDLINAVKDNAADIGFAFDGDGDRLGVVDGNGSIIFPDRQLMLFARDVLSRNPGAEIVFDVKCSSRLPMVIKKLGGKPVMWKTGHSFIKSKLKETGAPLAGEMSGHIFFKERWYGFDDALYASARLLEILMGLKQPPAEVFKKLPKGVATPELRVDLSEGEHMTFMEKLKQSADFGDAKLTTIDGVRADFADGWGLVRASNTTPSLVLRFEGDSKDALLRIGGLFKKTLLGIDPKLKLPF